MVDGPQHVAGALAQQSQIEVSVPIARIERQGALVAFLRLDQIAALVVEIAEIEVRQGYVRIGLQGAA